MNVTKLLTASAENFAIDTETHTAATATITAPGASKRLVILSVSVSFNAAPVSAVTIQVLDGLTVIKQYEIPAAAIAPMEFAYPHGLVCGVNNAASVTCGDPGASVKVTLGIAGFPINA